MPEEQWRNLHISTRAQIVSSILSPHQSKVHIVVGCNSDDDDDAAADDDDDDDDADEKVTYTIPCIV